MPLWLVLTLIDHSPTNWLVTGKRSAVYDEGKMAASKTKKAAKNIVLLSYHAISSLRILLLVHVIPLCPAACANLLLALWATKAEFVTFALQFI